ncbi:IS21 family transposase [Streptococcus agalactiae]|uniref:IS21 family transposase n=1 Tax=Streptococcus agalactiae TaxID=1311 RepID=UPI0013749B96|nr:IS21 family transposase [Streptococcus agalactiae]KAF1199024.1 hypothetical protein B8V53_08140 [Streptococcus agalactiae]KAF1217929.1 hypothetical protein B8V44_05935 [Streptococcus agalactiae]MBU8847854.1 IS21 family transposase [Streptococcus agalactiae]MCD0073295.1 IS21 family transposase [Streptococcus agalactiae]MCD0076823.1 IS21 family transposase [Streptococcus agalactiae]
MKNLMDKHSIIKLKNEGYSNREVAQMLSINRKTVAKYWNEYLECIEELNNPSKDKGSLLEQIASAPKYDSSNRKKTKYTKEIDAFLNQILEGETKKDKDLKNHKQALSVVQIHQMIVDAGFDISYPSIAVYVREKRKKNKECFIKQEYDYGDRLEYDFGEVKLMIDGKLEKLSLAVLSSPASNFRWAYLYTNQGSDVFFDSQVRFFEMVGGMYKEIVYDNMKNVVSRFIGKGEKELNSNLLIFANYYGFNINTTNCFKGNEKGHVEESVKIIRKSVFALKYEFKSLDEAKEYLEEKLIEINKNSKIEEEKKKLLILRPKYELAKITRQKVDSYGFVQVANNKYSVYDYLVGKIVTIRTYAEEVKIYYEDNLIASHKKKDGAGETSIDIRHYLDSLARKPGAIRNSLALKEVPVLKTIFDNHFIKEPKKFVEIIKINQEKTMDELLDVFKNYINFGKDALPKDIVKENSNTNNLEIQTRKIISMYDSLCIGGTYGHKGSI